MHKIKAGWLALVIVALAGALQAASPVDERLKALENRQTILERQQEVEQEKAKAAAAELPVVSAGKDGFGLKSADGAYQIKITGDLQVDSRFFLNDDAQTLADTFVIRRIRPSFEITYQKFFFGRIQTNFGQGTTIVEDAYLEGRFNPLATLRLGRFKPPVGLENMRSSTKLTFIERGLPTGLVPIYDSGFQLAGESAWAGYAISVANGAADGASLDTDTADRKDFAARIYAWPLKKGPAPLAGLLLGLSGSTGKVTGTTASPGLPIYRTETLNTVFAYRSSTIAAGKRERWNPQLAWNWGPMGLLAEHVSSRQTIQSTSTLATADPIHRSWQVAASYVLTREDALPQGGVKPRHPFELGKEGWGAWEVAARVSQWTADDTVYPTYAAATSAVRDIRAFTGGLNWYLTSNVKAQANYEYSRFDQGGATGDRPVERTILTRVQLAF